MLLPDTDTVLRVERPPHYRAGKYGLLLMLLLLLLLLLLLFIRIIIIKLSLGRVGISPSPPPLLAGSYFGFGENPKRATKKKKGQSREAGARRRPRAKRASIKTWYNII